MMCFFAVLDVISQSLMLYMMLSLSLGKSFAGIYKPIKSFSKLQQQTTSRIVAVLALLQVQNTDQQTVFILVIAVLTLAVLSKLYDREAMIGKHHF